MRRSFKRKKSSRGGPSKKPAFESRKSRGTWVYGRHVVQEALVGDQAQVLDVWLCEDEKLKLEGVFQSAQKFGAKVRWVSRKELDHLAGGGAHQGLAVRLLEKSPQSLIPFLGGLSSQEKASTVLVALDQIQDPHNMGAIARSAVCFGARGLISVERNSAPLTQAVLTASAGAIQKIPTFRVGNLAQTLLKLKDQGFWVYGADAKGGQSWDLTWNFPLVLVIGSEGKGLRPLVRSSCDELVSIPQSKAGVASLNASCAASVVLYEISRQVHV